MQPVHFYVKVVFVPSRGHVEVVTVDHRAAPHLILLIVVMNVEREVITLMIAAEEAAVGEVAPETGVGITAGLTPGIDPGLHDRGLVPGLKVAALKLGKHRVNKTDSKMAGPTRFSCSEEIASNA